MSGVKYHNIDINNTTPKRCILSSMVNRKKHRNIFHWCAFIDGKTTKNICQNYSYVYDAVQHLNVIRWFDYGSTMGRPW